MIELCALSFVLCALFFVSGPWSVVSCSEVSEH